MNNLYSAYHKYCFSFIAKDVAEILSIQFGIIASCIEPDDIENVDGEVTITDRVHVQVGNDYLVANAWVGDTTMRSWPARTDIYRTIMDVQEALRRISEYMSMTKANCQNCGEGYDKSTWVHIYCSLRCRVAACRKRKKAKEADNAPEAK